MDAQPPVPAPVLPAAPAAGAAEPAPPVERATGGTATLLSASGGIVGLLSYAVTLVMAHLLPAADYTTFAAAVAVVGTAGVASAALIPFPLAHVVRAHPRQAAARRAATAFAVGVSLLVGVLAAVVLALIVGPVSPVHALPTAVAAAVSGLALFAIAPVWGFLQGESRFLRYAALTVGEVAVRLVASVLAVVVGAGAWGAVGGFAVGAVVVLAVSLTPASGPFRGIAWADVRAALSDRARWAETGGVAGAQAVLSALAAADAVVVATLVTAPADAAAAAGYQAVSTLAKAPVYVAVGTALVSFPVLRVAAGPARDLRLREALGSYVRLLVPAAAVVATVPSALVGLVLPAQYMPAVALLPVLAVMGVGLGTTTVLATLLLAVRARGALVAALTAAVAALAGGLALGATGALTGLPGVPAGPTGGLAAGAALGAFAGAVLVAVLGAAHRPRPVGTEPGLVRAGATGVVYAVVVVALLAATRLLPGPVAVVGWVVAVGVVGFGLVGLPVLGSRLAPQPDAAGSPDRARGGLHVLHLAFEDPAMPGSGGGALRTAEIDRRLAAAGHHVTVLTGRYPGATDRIERHGTGSLAWVHPHVGRGRTRLTRLIPYMAAAFLAARRAGRRHPGDDVGPGPVDLVVEDFFAPISSMAIPAWTRLPTVGVVQWLNAREKARQYHLPVHWVERRGVATHRRIVAVSHGVGAATQALTPQADVVVIGNGVDPVAFTVAPRPVAERADVVFVGRLEIAQKGLDLLLDAWALAAPRLEGDLLLAGTGPDEAALRERAERLGVADRVRFLGWVAGRDKAELVAGARVAAVPSRFETFGIVAAEALAVGTPVVAYDIDCLREVVPAEGGVLVPRDDGAFDAAAYADALVDVAQDDPRRAVVARRGPEIARVHDWDALAATQDDFYRRVAAEASDGALGRRSAGRR
ncbi:glycosyltransferase family 4 protein [Actinomycetospora endophytica]|uniref:Glycosyltransferase family 4 protein n=1 Tax=Actinomycetospora endophytica TaxID=2291215 RepID=A0ABS8P497_9PSEU|nr:glycosyltransferase family 4 protein [Actinomycetospora endophytica]MCD2192365.1 glycosyltransferase family 4 protein [Actinomycetospora endophytica]